MMPLTMMIEDFFLCSHVHFPLLEECCNICYVSWCFADFVFCNLYSWTPLGKTEEELFVRNPSQSFLWKNCIDAVVLHLLHGAWLLLSSHHVAL